MASNQNAKRRPADEPIHLSFPVAGDDKVVKGVEFVVLPNGNHTPRSSARAQEFLATRNRPHQ